MGGFGESSKGWQNSKKHSNETIPSLFKKEEEMTKKFRSFADARKFVHSLRISGQREWGEFCKSGKKPNDIPSTPAIYKKEWKGWGDWLGTGATSTHKRIYRTFKEARKFVHSLKLKNQKDWIAFTKSGKIPADIPAAPRSGYKNEWKSLGDWLGTGTIATQMKNYQSFVKARRYVQALKLKNRSEWTRLIKTDKLPQNIPRWPDSAYKNEGWKSWGDWLDSGIVAPKNMKFRSFKDSRKFVHSLGLQSQKEWNRYRISKKRPVEIPSNPPLVYKKEWTSWGDWFGTGTVANQMRKYRSFKDSRKFVHSLGLSGRTQWQKFAKTGKLLKDIPSTPRQVYKKEWTSWGDWLGTGTVHTREIHENYDDFKTAIDKARVLAKKYSIKNYDDWIQAVKDGKIPKNIPMMPSRIYSKKRKK